MAIVKEVNIKISSVIENMDANDRVEGDREISDESYRGFLKLFENEMLLSYYQDTEGGRLFTDITVKGDTVTVKRMGAIESTMAFTEGKSVNSIYKSCGYPFDMRIITKKLTSNMTRLGGSIFVDYRMNVGGCERNVKMTIEAEGLNGPVNS